MVTKKGKPEPAASLKVKKTAATVASPAKPKVTVAPHTTKTKAAPPQKAQLSSPKRSSLAPAVAVKEKAVLTKKIPAPKTKPTNHVAIKNKTPPPKTKQVAAVSKTHRSPAVSSSDQATVHQARRNYMKAVKDAQTMIANDQTFDPGFLSSSDVHDEADLAQQNQLRELAEIQARARALNRPEIHPDFDGVHCVECDIVIPARRLEMMKVRCVDCQSEVEALAKRSQAPSSGSDITLTWDDPSS